MQVFGIKSERLGEEVGVLIHCKNGVEQPSAEVSVLRALDVTLTIIVTSASTYSGKAVHQFVKSQNKLAAFKVPRVHHIFFTKSILPRGT